jgi:hypothetical protein
MKSINKIAALMILLLPTAGAAQEATPTIEILSKDDARAMFEMTKEQWHSNVYQAVAAGAVMPMGTPETGYGMAMNTPDGDLLVVKPVYFGNDRSPDLIQVTVGYRPPRSALLTNADLEDAVRVAKIQMAPEYEVTASIEEIEGGVSIFFIIAERAQE